MVIDIHTHAWPEKVAARARENLESLFKVKLVGEPTAGKLLEFMEKNGVDLSVINGVAVRQEQVPSINNWLFSLRQKRIRVFCAMHPEYPAWKDEIIRVKDSGDGIKFQPEFQDFYVDSPSVYPIYERIESAGLPVLFHCGHELSGTMLLRSSPERILKVRKDFPGLKIIAAHFGGFRVWDEVRRHLLGKDIYFDTAFFFGYLPVNETLELLTAHPSDRLLFGSDFPLTDQLKDIMFLRDLHLPQELKDKIFFKNAVRLLNIQDI